MFVQLSYGLTYLRRVVEAKTYDERYQLLTPKLGFQQVFLQKWLQWEEESEQSNHGDGDGGDYYNHLLSSDPDPGPELAFAQLQFHQGSYDNDTPSQNQNQSQNQSPDSERHQIMPMTTAAGAAGTPSLRTARLAGYVMWDRARILNNPSNNFNLNFDFYSAETAAPQQRQLTPTEWLHHQDARHSLFRRRELFLRGARGWWSKDDESRLEWTGVDYYNLDEI